jgi:lipoprotein NlpI
MSAIKFGRLLSAVISLIFLVSLVTSCKAQKTAEEFFEEGKKYSLEKNFDQAINNYGECIKLNPKLVKAYNNRGVAYVETKQYDQAIADFSKAIELDSTNGKAYNNRAIAYWYKGEIHKVRQDVQKAQSLGISINPEFLKTIETKPPSTP